MHTLRVLTAGARRRERRGLWRNFQAAVWASIAYGALEAVWRLAHAAEIREAYPVYTARVLAGPAVFTLIQLALWWTAYREGDGGARAFAALMGVVILSFWVLVPLLLAGIGIGHPGAIETAGAAWVGASHLAFAALGRWR
jgi:hypothetical protein